MLNKVTLIGNLGADPDVRFTPDGAAVATVSIATTRSWKDKQGQKQTETEWHRVIFWNKQAEIVGEYLKKGSKLYVEGRLKTRKWQDKDGRDNYTTEIIANEMHMLDGKGKQEKPQQAPQDNDTGDGYPGDFDDDFPF